MAQAPGSGVGRRTIVGGVLGALVLPAAGCGIRLEDDAPRVPFVPTRTPVPAEPELVALTRDTAALAALAATVPGALAADLATVHRRQHTVLRTTLVRRQVPTETLDAAPATSRPATATTTSPGPTSPSPSTPGPSPAVDRAELARAEADAAAESGSFAGVQEDLRATVAALHAQRYAAASLLAGQPPDVPRDPLSGTDVAELAASTSAAVYLLEVVSARSTGRQRDRSDVTLAALRDVRADQLAGGSRPEEAIGHPLPFEVTDTADAARLAREALTALRAGYGERLTPLVTRHGGAGLAAATRWLGTVEVEAHRWGVDLAPFPGLE